MSAIFYTTYAKNIDRINNANHRPNSTERLPSITNFAEILADLQRGKTTAGDSPAPDNNKAVAAKVMAPLSNLTIGEQPAAKQSTQSVVPTVSPASFVTKSITPLPGLRPEVAQPLPSNPEPPHSPEILEAKRIKTPPPQMPWVPKGGEFNAIITKSGQTHGVDPLLGLAVARAESNFNPTAVSRDGHESKGLFQLLDSTGKEMMDRLGVSGSYQPFDPQQNTHIGMGYLRRLHNLFSDEKILIGSLRTHPASSAADLEKLAVAAFNAGEGNVARAQAKAKSLGKNPGEYEAIKPHLPSITRAYVERVLNTKLALAEKAPHIETV